jgi:hypothetical protein
MCRIKKKNQNDQSKRESSQKKSNESLITSEISLMIKRLIDESSESRLAESRSLVNSVNSHIIKKILNSDAIDHIFCNRSLFISYTPKTFICETRTSEKFISEKYESVVITLINENNRARDVTLTRMLYSFQMQYNLISIIKLVRKKVETFLRLSH